jgi:predicted DNA-binding transcriptional regulator AlpA
MRPLRETGLTLKQVRELPAAIDVSTAAKALGVSRASAYQSITEGTFPVAVIKVNRRLRVLTASLVEVLEGGADRAASA